MRFQSLDGSSYIQIDKLEGYPIFDVTAFIDGFAGRNKGITFAGCAEFLRQLRTFDARRQGAATLEGTEEFRLCISTIDRLGHMRVNVRVARARQTSAVALEGGFVFDAELASRLFEEMDEWLRDCP